MPRLSQSDLLNLVVRSIETGGWNSLIADQHKPFEVRVFKDRYRALNLRIYIWNCTHGGGAARAPDEYRIQFTGVVPRNHNNAITLLLGWHGGYEVFAAWDIRRHDNQASASPSAQIREEILGQAHARQFAVGTRANGELVVAFRPEFLVDYALSSASLHRMGVTEENFSLLNQIDSVKDEEISGIKDRERRKVVATIVRKFRESDFRKRVLGAYNHQCAMCGVQLELIDAAHILPVAADGSTDETINGIALCKLHHAAFDRNLVSFDEKYRIQVSVTEATRLSESNRGGGMSAFQERLRAALILPNDRRDYPPSQLISLSRSVRNWSL
ncbi:MAG TPA: HNH endonuclease [Xanthomonadaceae bacterium]